MPNKTETVVSKKCYIFDIDGTIADCSERLKFLDGVKESEDLDFISKCFDNFYDNVSYDEPIMPTVKILNALSKTANIILLTGRRASCVEATTNWLKKHKIIYDMIVPREDGDHRPDYVVKKELYEAVIKPMFEVLGVFEDRTSCVNMWRKLGLPCYQVCDGNY